MTTGPGPIRPKHYTSLFSKATLDQQKKELSLTVDGKVKHVSVEILGKGVKRFLQKMKATIQPRKYLQLKVGDQTVLVKCSKLARAIQEGKSPRPKGKTLKKLLKSAKHPLLKEKGEELLKIGGEIAKIKKLAKNNLRVWKQWAAEEGGAIHISKAQQQESGGKYGFTVTDKGEIHLHTRIPIGKGGQKTVTFAVNIQTMKFVARARVKSNPETIEKEQEYYREFPNDPHVLKGHNVTIYGTKGGTSSAMLMELCAGDLEPSFDTEGNYSSPVKNPVKGLHQYFQGIAKSHKKGIALNDIKNENAMVDIRGNVKVGDPGSARNMRKDVEKTIRRLGKLSKLEAKINKIKGKIDKLNEEIKGQPKNVGELKKKKTALRKKIFRISGKIIETEPFIKTLWGLPEYTISHISPEAFSEKIRDLLPKKADLAKAEERTRLSNELQNLIDDPKKMKELSAFLFSRDLFAFGGTIYQHRAKRELTPWHDLGTIIDNIENLDPTVLKAKGEEKTRLQKLGAENPTIQSIKNAFKRTKTQRRELTKQKRLLGKELKNGLKLKGLKEGEKQKLENALKLYIKGDPRIVDNRDLKMLIEHAKSKRVRHLAEEIVEREEKIVKPTLKAIAALCKKELNIDLPVDRNSTEDFVRNLTRAHQEALSYTEPDKSNLLAHLEWELHDPNPAGRPPSEEVERRMREIRKLKK